MNEVICPQHTSCLMFVGDNTDHDLATLDGKNTHHGLGCIAIANGTFGKNIVLRKRLPREEKVPWSEVEGNDGISIKSYNVPTKSSLKETLLVPLEIEEFSHSLTNVVCGISRLITEGSANWAGYMSSLPKHSVLQKSVVSMLPIINLPSTDVNALYSLLVYVSDQCSRLDVPMPTITFDQPLYVKAYDIVASMNMNIFVRLGGFHQLMSFLGSIGSVMEGSGLRTALETIYAPLAVNHMISGKAYSRALRAHILVSSALTTLLFEEFWSNLGTSERDKLISLYESKNPCGVSSESISMKLMDWYERKEASLSAASRTAKLWLMYLRYVSIVQTFIEAERTHDWALHVHATKLMLNLFAATGHNNYARTCRLYLQSISSLENENPEVHAEFVAGNHTVRRSEKAWSGIWTDLAIEQILMKSLKGRGGVVSKGMTENVTNVWTKTMHRCAEISDAVDQLLTSTSCSNKHKEQSESRSHRDASDYEKLLDWFRARNPFETGQHLMALDSGISDESNCVTCDEAESIGRLLQQKLDNVVFTNCSFSRKEQVKNLLFLYSKIRIDKQDEPVNPLTLFLRLAFAIERREEKEMESYFHFELTPYPTSLFKAGVMRPADNKSTLKTHLLKSVEAATFVEGGSIADGGALLWSVKWSKNEDFSEIARRYISKCNRLGIGTVVFDGYNPSTKDVTRDSRYRSATLVVDVSINNCSPTDSSEFLSSISNKKSLISFLGNKMENEGIKVVFCDTDADTTIVKKAICSDGESVNVLADDTDILCLLLHHTTRLDPGKNIFMSSMKCDKSSGQHITYRIQDIVEKNDQVHVKYILFAHAFCGCDTTSSINRLGKTQILGKLSRTPELRDLADNFYSDDTPCSTIGEASVRIFEILCSPPKSSSSSLPKLRKQKYLDMISRDRSSIDPSYLPPSPRAAYFHGLRVYHQVLVWRSLLDNDVNPQNWGWERKGEKLRPVMTDIAAGPQDILKVIRCSCKLNCGKNCSCVKVGLNCTHLCKECQGVSCTNTPATVDNSDEY